jgi:hypothetical protein
VMDAGMGVVIFIFGGVWVVADEGADLSLQPMVAIRAKAMMPPSERSPSPIFCID